MYKVIRDSIVYSMSKDNVPAIEVEDGAQIVFETCDCFGNQIQSEDAVLGKLDWERINPATGPVFLAGAAPGDVLAVRIDDIKVNSTGVMMTGEGLGVMGDVLKDTSIKMLPIVDDKVCFSEKLQIPIKPMIGVIGTAPAYEACPNGTPGPHGGNMDTKVITKGATVYLPVEVNGALLALGDLHAVMGDGEVAVCGAEVQGEVTVTVNVIKSRPFDLPMVENAEMMYTIASAETLDEAVAAATRNMVEVLKFKGLSDSEAIMLLSLVGNTQISQIVDPLKTARFELPRWVYETL